jgi:hypothetical protein
MLLCVLFYASGAVSETPARGGQRSRPGTAFRGGDDHVWQTFSPPEGYFKVDLPSAPYEVIVPVNLGTELISMRAYRLETPVAAYLVSYVDYSRSLVDPAEIEKAFDGGSNRLTETAKGYVISQKKIATGNIPGREVVIENGVAVVKLRMYLVKNRLYQVVVSYPDPNNTSEGLVKFYNANNARFFDSFVINAAAGKKK